jgi:NTE family protein
LKRGRLKLFGPDRREMKNPAAIARDRDEAEQRAKRLADKLRELGVDVSNADTIIGTSAGSVVGTHVRLGTPREESRARLEGREPLKMGSLGVGDGTRFMRAALSRSREHGRSLIGRAALQARTSTEEEFIHTVAADLEGVPWPEKRLILTTVDAATGELTLFTNDSEVPLDRAVTASCSVPGVFPPITIRGRQYVDGGVRSAANVDLAVGHDIVLALAPIPLGVRRYDWPGAQARRLRDHSRTLVVIPDGRARSMIGLNPLDITKAPISVVAGEEQAERVADRIARLWN